jgi:hypothetical protein
MQAILFSKSLNICLYNARKIISPLVFVSNRSLSFHAEPDYGVKSTPFADPRKVKIPYLREEDKQEIYCKFITNPKEWTVEALSKLFGMNPMRTKAVIYNMHTRCKMMREKGLIVEIKGKSVTVEIPPMMKSLYEKYKKDKTIELSKLLEEYNHEQTDETLKTTMTPESYKKMIDDLEDHELRMANQEAYLARMNKLMEHYQKNGINTQFQETPNRPSTTTTFEETYRPQFLHDDEIEQEKQYLLKRIASETQAKVKPTIEQYYATSPYINATTTTMNSDTSIATPIPKQEKPLSSTEKVSRWKIAFRDISNNNNNNNNNKKKTSSFSSATGIGIGTGSSSSSSKVIDTESETNTTTHTMTSPTTATGSTDTMILTRSGR